MEIDRIELADFGEPTKIASEIHRQIGECPLPIPVEAICAAVGITDIRSVSSKGFEGGLITDAEKFEGIILVNEQSKLPRRQFTIGHELGHFLNPWHKPVDGHQFMCNSDDMWRSRSGTMDRGTKMEVEANEFSAEILMPRPRFQKALGRRAGADLDYILDLAATFGVSKEAAASRYVDLHDEACAVIFSKDGRIRYVHKKRAFPFLDVWAKMPLPANSLSIGYDGQIGSTSDWAEIDAGVWLQNRTSELIYEQTLQQQDQYQMTLLTIEDDEEAGEEAELVEAWTPRFRRK